MDAGWLIRPGVHNAWTQFAAVAVAHLLAVAAPGPDFAMVLRQSLSHGRRVAIWSSVGIGTAILMHVTYALLGIGVLIKGSPVAFSAVKYAGAAYLAWIGFRALRSLPGTAEAPEQPDRKERAVAAGSAEPRFRMAWSAGFLTNALNPKATLFFLALFTTVIDPRTPKLILILYGLWMSFWTTAWFSMVAVFFTREPIRRAFLRNGHLIDRAMGVVFMGFAALLALSSIG